MAEEMSAPATDAATFRFTSEELQHKDGPAILRDLVGRTILKLDVALLADRRLHFETTTRVLPGLRIASARASGLSLARTRGVLADSNDDFTFFFNYSGSAIETRRSRELMLGPGDATLISNAIPGSIAWPSPARTASLQFPREALAGLITDVDDAVVRLVPRDSEAMRLLGKYLGLVVEGPQLADRPLQGVVAGYMRDIVAVALGAGRDARAFAEEGGMRAARLHAIKTDVAEHLFEVEALSVVSVAARHRISPRYVQMLFEREGTTFSEFVLRQRLAQAHRVLADASNTNQRIGDIAFETGFGDLSYFNKAFRRRYGLAPSDVRANAMLRSRLQHAAGL